MCIPLVAACALLASCGQRGALYLPEEDRNVVVTPAPAPAPAASPAASPAPPPAATPTDDSDTDTQRRNSTPPAR